MESAQLHLLIQKYLTGTATPEERAAVESWYRTMHREDIEVPMNSPGELKQTEQKILTDLQNYIRHRNAPARKRLPANKWWAAAAILILLAGGYRLLNREVPGRAQQQDLKPGKNAAILTLANGTQVTLDSNATGVINAQNSVAVVTNTGSQLTYKTKQQTTDTAAYNTLTTAKGNRYQLVLPDGTKAWLNAASSIRFPVAFTGNRRPVEVTGEVYFDVVHNAAQPFCVKAGNEILEDVGTAFDVNAYADENAIRTTLISGALKVNNATILKPGEQAVVQADGKLSVDKHADLSEITAWKNDMFIFHSMDMKAILRQAARWYNVEIVYEGNFDETFSGGISRNVNASDLLKILSYSGKVNFKIEGDKIIVKQNH